ncbi:MAG: J domain-containing protein [Bacteroidetes bacterium]|nr:J domain-containing protein [Bacteroidota bacterium]
MQIKYFSTKSTPEQLKARRKELWKKHHPDKFPDSKKEIQHAIMVEINAEYDYLYNYKQPIKEPVFNGKFHRFAEDQELKKQAQNIFNSLSNTKNIDYNLLLTTINSVKNWNELFSIYGKMYGASMTFHILSKVKDKKKLNIIMDSIPLFSAKNDEEFFKTAVNILRNIF